ncbi:MAG TPA: hypothetical protein VF017_03405 [Thermoanaerobaculia bacterium]|nr:hypothetical protein [Thermoanaerobaculia bacterium]
MTLDLPRELLERAKAQAEHDGTPLQDLLARVLDQGLSRLIKPQVQQPLRRRSELPVARPSTGRPLPALTNAELHRLLDEEDLLSGRQS